MAGKLPLGGNAAFGAAVTYSTTPHTSFPAGAESYMDGSLSDWATDSASQLFTKGHHPGIDVGNWGWNTGSPITITLDYAEAREGDFFYIQGAFGSGGVVRPTAVKLEWSDNNSSWTTVADKTSLTGGGAPGTRGWIAEFDTAGESHRYWRVVLTFGATWLFVNAIVHGGNVVSRTGVHTVSPAASGSYPIIPYSRLLDGDSDWNGTDGSHALVVSRKEVDDSFTGMVGVQNVGGTTTHTLDNGSAKAASFLYLLGYGGGSLIEEPTSIIIQYSDNGSSWTTHETRGSLGDQGQPGEHHWVALFDIEGEVHRYWRAQCLHGGEWLHVAAFELWGTVVDKAIGMDYTVSPTTNANFPQGAVTYRRTLPGETTWQTKGNKLTDGQANSPQTFGTGVGWAANSSGVARIDLESAQGGDYIAFYGINGNGTNMRTPTTVTIAHSDDDTNWTTVWADASLSSTGGGALDRWVAAADISGSGSHRYWRISLNEASFFFVLSQIEFWQTTAGPPGEGEATGAITWAGEAFGDNGTRDGAGIGAITWAGAAFGDAPSPPLPPTGLTVPWLEVWSRPGADNYGKKIADLPFLDGSVQVPYSGVGKGSMRVPSNYPRLDEILLVDKDNPEDSVWSTIKVMDDTGWLYEWLPGPRVPPGRKDDHSVDFAGDGLESMWGFARVEPWDWDGSVNWQSTFPDWIWGGRNLLTNPGFEDSGISPIIDEIWVTGPDEDTDPGGTFTISDGTNTTDPLAWDVSPGVMEGELEAAGIYDDCLVGGEGTVDNPWTVEAVEPFEGVAITVNGSGLTGGGETGVHIRRIQFGSLQPTGWSKSITVSDGTPRAFGAFDSFRVTTDEPHSGIYSLRMDPAPIETAGLRYPGAQQVVTVKPGGIYQASIWIYSTSSTDTYRFVIRGVDGDFIKSSTGGLTSFTLTANTWTQVTIDDVAVGTNSAVIFRIANTNPAGIDPAVFYVDDAEFNEGMMPTTVGCMLQALYDDATLDHVADGRFVWENEADPGVAFLLLDFNCTVDSNGDPWDRDDVNQTFQPRMSYLQVIDQIVEEGGYQWRVMPADVDAGTYILQVYNPEGLGSVVDAGIIAGSTDTGRAAKFFAPTSTAQLAEGEDNMSARVESAGLISAFGRIEGSILDQNWTTFSSLTSAATQMNSEMLVGATDVVYTLASPEQRPLVMYRPGDRIYIADDEIFGTPGPGDDPRLVRRVSQIQLSMSKGQTDEWTVHISDALPFRFVGGAGVKLTRGLLGQAATDNAVAALLAAYKPPRRVPLPSTRVIGGGGQMTVTVAASNATDLSKGKADFQCDGENDDQVVQQAFDALGSRGGKVVLSEGRFNFGAVGVIFPPVSFHLHGMGRDATEIRAVSEDASYLFLDGLNTGEDEEHRISDMLLNGDDKATYGITNPNTAGGQNNVFIDNVEVRDFENHGIYLPRPAGGWRLRRSLFVSNGGAGVFAVEAGISAIDCEFTANATTGLLIGLDGYGVVTGCLFNTNGSGGLGGANALTGGQAGFVVVGCQFLTNTGYGINQQDGGDWIIESCYFEGNTTGSISFGAGAFGVSTNNFVTGNIQVGSGTFVNLGAGSSAVVCNNVVNGVLVQGDCDPGAGGDFLPLAGGTMTGDLVLAGDPTAALEAATKQYVDDIRDDAVQVAGDTMTGLLVLSGDPAAALGAATKQYVDATFNPQNDDQNQDITGFTNTSYADLDALTTAPFSSPVSVSVVTGSSALVLITATRMRQNTTGTGFLGYRVSGATTVAADDDYACRTAAGEGIRTTTFHHVRTGLTPGTNVFELQARVTAGDNDMSNPVLTVIAL